MKKILPLLLLAFATTNAQVITTIAGNGTIISGGDGGPATAAGIYGPGGAVVDASNNIYISEYYGNRVRKISPSGIITTIAGNGIAGYSGDGGPATAASINKPSKIVLDASNNIYFADLDNSCIRKITPAGIITTVAGIGVAGYSGDGGPATAAKLNRPSGISIDLSGNLIITDYANSLIRKVTTAGIITTVAGSATSGSGGDGGPATAAQLNQPWGATMDASGNLFIADMVNHKIRKVSTAGIITTFAGTGTAGFSGDGGPATGATFDQPSCIRFDGSGNIYVSDQLNNRIRKISSSGIITTIAGNGVAGYAGDGGPATAASLNSTNDMVFDNSGNLIIIDNSNNRVRKLANVVTGLNWLKQTTDIASVYPNPVLDIMHVELKGKYTDVHIAIMDQIGNIVREISNVACSADVYISDLPPAIYVVRIQCDDQIIYKKILKRD